MASIKMVTELPGPRSRALMAERTREVARGPFHTTPIFVDRGEGALLHDVDGNTLLDFAAGIGVVNTGHATPQVAAAIAAQAERLIHGSFNVTPYEGYVEVCARLNQVAPGHFPKKTFLANSGAEAVENAIKIARAHTGRQAVVSFQHGFHGRTYMAMSLTDKVKPYRAGFGPFCGEVHRAPFPDAYRWPGEARSAMPSEGGRRPSLRPEGEEPRGYSGERPPLMTSGDVAAECMAAFEELVHVHIGENQLAAVIIEPVTGEGGFIPAPAAFLQALSRYCTQHGAVLIADEIQSGFGRTGTLFACEQLGLEPDLVTIAKGLGGGMPISAVTGRAAIMDAPAEGGIGGTFGGNPVSCAAALAVLDRFADGSLLSHARAIGQRLRARLLELKERHPVIGDVRGLGPMQAIELVRDRASKAPAPELVKQLLAHCHARGLIVMSAGSHGNVLRFLPPLVIEPAQLDEGLDVLAEGLAGLRA